MKKNKITLDFLTHESMKDLTMSQRVTKIISRIKDNKIIVIDSHLSPQDEALLIQKTMEKVTKRFPGIEISSLSAKKLDKNARVVDKVRDLLNKLIIGKERGITVIGPAKIIKEVKRSSDQISLFMK